MAFLTRERGIWVSAAAKETAFGTAQTLDSRIRVEAGNFINPAYETIDDGDLLGATQEASSQVLLARAFEMPFNIPRVPPHALAFIAAYAMGDVDTFVGLMRCRRAFVAPEGVTVSTSPMA